MTSASARRASEALERVHAASARLVDQGRNRRIIAAKLVQTFSLEQIDFRDSHREGFADPCGAGVAALEPRAESREAG